MAVSMAAGAQAGRRSRLRGAGPALGGWARSHVPEAVFIVVGLLVRVVFWQVTGRNLSTFQERVQIDVEYVRNWSPWLDIYVLARTVPVVVGGTGS